jgi:hypothetical protein
MKNTIAISIVGSLFIFSASLQARDRNNDLFAESTDLYSVDLAEDTITATAGPNGTIAPSGTVLVTSGSNQTFTFSPDTGYHIVNIQTDTGNVAPAPSFTFTDVDTNHTINVTFAYDTLTIIASAGPHGFIALSGNVMVPYGSFISFAINPAVGYHTLNIIVDSVVYPPASHYVFPDVISDHTITATFAIDTETITATAGANGSLTPSGSVAVLYGADTTFTITPDTGYHTATLLVDGVHKPISPTYVFTHVAANHSISASFAIDTNTITSTAFGHGSITPSGTIKVLYGNDTTFSIASDSGYHFLTLRVDTSIVALTTSYTFHDVISHHSITATFAPDTFFITATAGANGTISPIGTVPVAFATTPKFSIIPNPQYVSDTLTVDGVNIGGFIRSYTFPSISAGHTISITFRPQSNDSVSYRSFPYDSLLTATAVKKKAVTQYWKFVITNTTLLPVSEIDAVFKNQVLTFLNTDSLVPSGSRTSWTFSGTLAAGDSVTIIGRSTRAGLQKISKLWLGPVTRTATAANIVPTLQYSELPMPNSASILDDAFARGAFNSTGGLVVGVPRADSARKYGWVVLKTGSEFANSLYNNRVGSHTNIVSGFNFVGKKTSLPPTTQNNVLFALVATLKLNIALSDLQTTTPGFGGLMYREPGSPYDGFLVQEIALKGDTLLTYHTNSPTLAKQLDTVLTLINGAFVGPIDTLDWSDSLVLTPLNQLNSVAYLQQTQKVPAIILPWHSPETVEELPLAPQLYQNYPNPFNPTTRIQFALPYDAFVTLKVYNILGQEVTVLLNREQMGGGVMEVAFNASNLASGVYFYRITVDGIVESVHFSLVKRMLLIK